MDHLPVYAEIAGTKQLAVFESWLEGPELDLVVALGGLDRWSAQLLTPAVYEGATKLVKEKWAAHQGIVAWMEVSDGIVHEQDGRISWPLGIDYQDDHGDRGPGNSFTSYSLVRIRARKERGWDVRFGVLGVGSLADLPSEQLAGLRGLVADFAQPVVMETPVADFTYHRDQRRMEASVDWGGRAVTVGIAFDPDEPVFAHTPGLAERMRSELAFLSRILRHQRRIDARCRAFTAANLLASAQEWRSDDLPAPPLSAEQFGAALQLRDLQIRRRGRAVLEYDAGDIFGGHGVLVYLTGTLLRPNVAEMA